MSNVNGIRWNTVKSSSDFKKAGQAFVLAVCSHQAVAEGAGSVHTSQPWPVLLVALCNHQHTQSTTLRTPRVFFFHLSHHRLFQRPAIHRSVLTLAWVVATQVPHPYNSSLHLAPPPCRSPNATSTRSTINLQHMPNACLPPVMRMPLLHSTHLA